jgi:hypothetical protein
MPLKVKQAKEMIARLLINGKVWKQLPSKTFHNDIDQSFAQYNKAFYACK